MAGLLRVTILNHLPATPRTLYRTINAPRKSIDSMLTELVDKGRIELRPDGKWAKSAADGWFG